MKANFSSAISSGSVGAISLSLAFDGMRLGGTPLANFPSGNEGALIGVCGGSSTGFDGC